MDQNVAGFDTQEPGCDVQDCYGVPDSLVFNNIIAPLLHLDE
jgi:hypothetical protein